MVQFLFYHVLLGAPYNRQALSYKNERTQFYYPLKTVLSKIRGKFRLKHIIFISDSTSCLCVLVKLACKKLNKKRTTKVKHPGLK